MIWMNWKKLSKISPLKIHDKNKMTAEKINRTTNMFITLIKHVFNCIIKKIVT